jgi:hypothetical protein
LKPFFFLFLNSPKRLVMLQPNDKRLFILWLLVLCLPLTAAAIQAQESSTQASPSSDKATLFWNSDDNDRGLRWDLSEEPGVFIYVERLRQQRPRDRIIYIGYGPLGEVAWYLWSIKDWLKRVTPVEANQVVTLDGGRGDKLRYEAWLVPEGAEMPKVTGPPPEDPRAVLEFATYSYEAACEYCDGQGNAVLNALVQALRQRPQRKAYLEFYGCGRSRRQRPISTARREASKVRRMLTKQGGIAPSRIIVRIRENSKSSCAAQVWLLPPHLNSLQR